MKGCFTHLYDLICALFNFFLSLPQKGVINNNKYKTNNKKNICMGISYPKFHNQSIPTCQTQVHKPMTRFMNP